jgi:hypothetical protein
MLFLLLIAKKLVAASGRLATIAPANHPCPPTPGGLAMNTIATYSHQPWNKGKLVGQKAPLRLRDIWVLPLTEN